MSMGLPVDLVFLSQELALNPCRGGISHIKRTKATVGKKQVCTGERS